MCGVACGRLDGFYEIGYGGPWDVAAGAVIVKEAGGIVIDPSGKATFKFRSPCVKSVVVVDYRSCRVCVPQPCGLCAAAAAGHCNVTTCFATTVSKQWCGTY